VQCKLYQHSVGHPWVFAVIMDSSSRQRDKQGLAMAMKSSFKHSCSSKRDEQGLAMAMRSSFKMFEQVQCEEALGGELARGNKHIICNVKYVYIFKAL